MVSRRRPQSCWCTTETTHCLQCGQGRCCTAASNVRYRSSGVIEARSEAGEPSVPSVVPIVHFGTRRACRQRLLLGGVLIACDRGGAAFVRVRAIKACSEGLIDAGSERPISARASSVLVTGPLAKAVWSICC